jgi:hypothetical protein
LDELEQAVAWANIPPLIGLDDHRWPLAANPWIDDAQEDRPLGKPCGIGREQIGRRLWIACRGVGEEIDDGDAGCHLKQHRLHLASVGTMQSEIGEEHDHAIQSPKFASRLGDIEGFRFACRGQPCIYAHSRLCGKIAVPPPSTSTPSLSI